MIKRELILAGVSVVLLGDVSIAQVGQSEPQHQTGTRTETGVTGTGSHSQTELTSLVRESRETLARMEQGENRIPQEQLRKAQCVAIFPSVTRVAAGVGGHHGDGVATCKGSDNQWSQVGFLNLTGASLGAQVGADQSSVVLLFTSNRAKELLNRDQFTLGADASVTAGDVSKAAVVDTAGSDIIAYAHSSGAFIGASLNGTRVDTDEDDMKAFYGEAKTAQQALSSFTVPRENIAINELHRELSRIS